MKEGACVALGSNLGDRESHVAAALVALMRTPGIFELRCSGLWETAPVGGPSGQGPYLNAAARFQTTLAPRELLERLLVIERAEGRERSVADAPRTLDLDLLFYGENVIHEEGLVVPHPRLQKRPFVLAPLREIAAEWQHPEVGVTVAEIALLLERSGSWRPEEVVRWPSLR